MVLREQCDHCRRRIVWALTEARRMQPLDPQPTENGTVWAYQEATGRWRARARQPDDSQRRPWERPYTPHHATCGRPPRPEPDKPRPTHVQLEIPPVTADVADLLDQARGPRRRRPP